MRLGIPPGSGRARLAMVAWMALVLALSVIPTRETGSMGFAGVDKVGHAVCYFVLGLLAVRAQDRGEAGARWIVAFGLAVLYGGVLEVGQGWVDRDPSLWDWIADGVGAAAGAAVGLVATDEKEEGR